MADLEVASTLLVDEPVQAGCLVSSARRAAELAAARGDRAAARHYADIVTALWSEADPALHPVVERIRHL